MEDNEAAGLVKDGARGVGTRGVQGYPLVNVYKYHSNARMENSNKNLKFAAYR